jgi:hypothetical protein
MEMMPMQIVVILAVTIMLSAAALILIDMAARMRLPRD